MGVMHGKDNSRQMSFSKRFTPVAHRRTKFRIFPSMRGMLSILVLLFVSSTLAIAINSSPGSLLQPGSNVSSLLSSLDAVSATKCAVRSLDYRHNVRAIDCLNLFTFILATEDHTKKQTFILPPDAAPGATVYSRRAGTCELGVIFSAGNTAVESSVDEILRAALRVVGRCLLDNRPDWSHCTSPSLWQSFSEPYQMMSRS